MNREMPPRFCSDCAHVLSETDRFCSGCGMRIETTPSHTATPVKRKSLKNDIVRIMNHPIKLKSLKNHIARIMNHPVDPKSLKNDIVHITNHPVKSLKNRIIRIRKKQLKTEMTPRFCSDCGHVLPQSARFCSGCGVGIETTGSQTPTPVKAKSSKGWVPGALMIAVGLIAGAFGYGLFNAGRNAMYIASLIGWQFVHISELRATNYSLVGGALLIAGLVSLIVGVIWVAKRL